MPRIQQGNAVSRPQAPPDTVDPGDVSAIVSALWESFLSRRQQRCMAAGVDHLHEYTADTDIDLIRAAMDTLHRMLRHEPIKVQR